ncbi:hypothetical protein [Nostoc sp.]
MFFNAHLLTQNPHEEETAHAPLEGASPQFVQGVSELEEELPAVTDCTTLTLVDDAQSNPATLRDAARTLLAENQNCGVEAAASHEGICSAAPVAQNEKSLNSAIDPALQIVIKKLLAKFPQWGVAIVDGVLVDWNAKLK